MSDTVEVTLNGEPTRFPAGATVADAVAHAGVEDEGARGVAVALDGEVVVRASWTSVELAEGQQLEVVRAIQGGER